MIGKSPGISGVFVRAAILVASATPAIADEDGFSFVPLKVELKGFPNIQQDDEISCGVASAAMVLKYYGIDAGQGPLKTVAATRWFEAGNFRVGMTAPEGVRNALRSRGVAASIYKSDRRGLVNVLDAGKPAIVLVRSGATTWHWFVAYGHQNRGEEFFISDPAGRRYTMTYNQLAGAMEFSHDLDGRPAADRPCSACNGSGKMTRLSTGEAGGELGKILDGGGVNGVKIEVKCVICNGSKKSPDMYRKAVESAGVSGFTMVVPDRPPSRQAKPAAVGTPGMVVVTFTNDAPYGVDFFLNGSGSLSKPLRLERGSTQAFNLKLAEGVDPYIRVRQPDGSFRNFQIPPRDRRYRLRRTSENRVVSVAE